MKFTLMCAMFIKYILVCIIFTSCNGYNEHDVLVSFTAREHRNNPFIQDTKKYVYSVNYLLAKYAGYYRMSRYTFYEGGAYSNDTVSISEYQFNQDHRNVMDMKSIIRRSQLDSGVNILSILEIHNREKIPYDHAMEILRLNDSFTNEIKVHKQQSTVVDEPRTTPYVVNQINVNTSQTELDVEFEAIDSYIRK